MAFGGGAFDPVARAVMTLGASIRQDGARGEEGLAVLPDANPQPILPTLFRRFGWTTRQPHVGLMVEGNIPLR